MKFASCCFATFLVCLVSFHQSSSFRLHHGKPDQNEINELSPGRYYIQNVATGLVIGALSRQNSTWDHGVVFGCTMESLEEATRDPEQKSMVLWELDRQYMIDYTLFRSVGPYNDNNLVKTPWCMYGVCTTAIRKWALFSRGPGIWGIRAGHLLSPVPIVLDSCLTGQGLHRGIVESTCNPSKPDQSWRLIRDGLD